MTTRAQQFEIFASGALYNGSVLNDGYARFYAAGTTNLKNAYEDKDKSVSCTTKTLDAQGRAEVFGDGIYKIRLYEGDPDDGGVLRDEIDNYKCTAVIGNVIKVTDDYTADRDDYMVLVDTTSKSITISLDDVNNFDNPIIIKKIHANNTVTVDPYSTQTIDADSTVDITNVNESLNLIPDIETDVWRTSNILYGLTATIAEINSVVGDNTATAEEITAICDADSNNPPITGDDTVGRVLRVIYLHIQDATEAAKIKCNVYDVWNGDTIDVVDNIPNAASFTGGFKYIDTQAGQVDIESTSLSGNCVAVLSAEISENSTGTNLVAGGAAYTNNIRILFSQVPNSTPTVLSTLVDTGDITVRITYLTDS